MVRLAGVVGLVPLLPQHPWWPLQHLSGPVRVHLNSGPWHLCSLCPDPGTTFQLVSPLVGPEAPGKSFPVLTRKGSSHWTHLSPSIPGTCGSQPCAGGSRRI